MITVLLSFSPHTEWLLVQPTYLCLLFHPVLNTTPTYLTAVPVTVTQSYYKYTSSSFTYAPLPFSPQDSGMTSWLPLEYSWTPKSSSQLNWASVNDHRSSHLSILIILSWELLHHGQLESKWCNWSARCSMDRCSPGTQGTSIQAWLYYLCSI